MSKETKVIDKIGRFRNQEKRRQFRLVVRNYSLATGLPLLQAAKLIRDTLDRDRLNRRRR